MPPKPETLIVTRIMNFLKANYPGYWLKIHGGPMQQRGVPDIIGCHRGKWYSFEVKQDEYEQPTALQVDNGNDIINARGRWAVIYDVRQVKQYMKEWVKK